MMDTVGFVELSSIVTGIEVLDAMTKVANVNIISAKASCPGKYYIMISGTVSGVESSLKEAKIIGRGFIVSNCILPRIHESVIKAINVSNMPEKIKAIGGMEFFNVTDSIIAADIAVKTSNVELIDVRLGTGIGGKSFVLLTGDVGAVKTAIDAGSVGFERDGMLVNKIVIANPKRDIIESLF